MEHCHGKFFRAFLVIYAGFLIFHSLNLDWDSWTTWLSVGTGLLLAAVAHARHGWSTIVLLCVHMVIEWISYAEHGAGFTSSEVILQVIHTALDITFLWQEIRIHMRRYRYYTFTAIIGALAILFTLNYEGAGGAHEAEHSHGDTPIEAIVIGGILGCTLSHLLRRRKKSI
jgi:hypothetical protein